eukprot:scaffold455_cov116-Isochrysis_galbana.AAC.5
MATSSTVPHRVGSSPTEWSDGQWSHHNDGTMVGSRKGPVRPPKPRTAAARPPGVTFGRPAGCVRVACRVELSRLASW